MVTGFSACVIRDLAESIGEVIFLGNARDEGTRGVGVGVRHDYRDVGDVWGVQV
jgi:hypothetical protein